MAKKKEVFVPRSMPLDKRVRAVGQQLREWFQSFDAPVDPENNALRSIGMSRRSKHLVYRYQILENQADRRRRRPNDTAA